MWVKTYHYALILMLAFAIVASLQAVGVVLVAAMLVIPAAAAFLLTDRLSWMLVLAAAFGMLSGGLGAFLSFVGRNLPTGPVMVLTASLVFAGALFFAPRHGILAKWWRHKTRSRRVARENTLKAVYRILEDEGFRSETVSLHELASARRETLEHAERSLRALVRHDLATRDASTNDFTLTPSGWKRACEIVRNHRLWELYLNHAANIPADHVHDEAEEIEHILGEETVRQLEKRLNYARKDPHGKLIPGLEDITASGNRFAAGSATGFGGTRP
jgi:manganese/zinc/iron transport system permease protein